MFSSLSFLHARPNWKNLTILCISACLIRLIVFGTYLQYDNRYQQPDSPDYHACAARIALGKGMTLVNQSPIFWRTPGYPLFLVPFYKWQGVTTGVFHSNTWAQKAALWVQIVLCSLLPLLVFFLARSLTQRRDIAWTVAWISVFHIGFVLASGYLLTEALSQLFFLLFLFYFYQSFVFLYEPTPHPKGKTILVSTLWAAVFLALYTWFRPNGQWMVFIAAALLLCNVSLSWKKKWMQIMCFITIFFLCLSPWYLRNYRATEKLFFCPMMGTYLQSFAVPKILRRVHHKPITECWQYAMYIAQKKIEQDEALLRKTKPHLFLADDYSHAQLALPAIQKYPYYFLCDWTQEVIKTTFDLYSYQLVAFATHTHTSDPLEEFLSEKISDCLYKQSIPLWMRLICWLEFLGSLCIWIGIGCGIIVFIIYPLIVGYQTTTYIKKMSFVWLKTGIIIGVMIGMTGGFGYARLRIPVEPLIILLACTFWFWLLWYKDEKITAVKHKKGIK